MGITNTKNIVVKTYNDLISDNVLLISHMNSINCLTYTFQFVVKCIKYNGIQHILFAENSTTIIIVDIQEYIKLLHTILKKKFIIKLKDKELVVYTIQDNIDVIN